MILLKALPSVAGKAASRCVLCTNSIWQIARVGRFHVIVSQEDTIEEIGNFALGSRFTCCDELLALRDMRCPELIDLYTISL